MMPEGQPAHVNSGTWTRVKLCSGVLPRDGEVTGTLQRADVDLAGAQGPLDKTLTVIELSPAVAVVDGDVIHAEGPKSGSGPGLGLLLAYVCTFSTMASAASLLVVPRWLLAGMT